MPNDALSKIKKLQAQAQAILDDREAEYKTSTAADRWQDAARFFVYVFRSFRNNRCFVRASSLAYTTLLALVPVLAVVIGVSASLLKDESGKNQIHGLVTKFVGYVAPYMDSAGPRITVGSGAAGGIQATSGPVQSAAVSTNLLITVLSTNQQTGLVTTNLFTGVLRTNPTTGVVTTNLANATPATMRAHELADQIHNYISRLRTGTLGATGVVALLFIAISLLSSIEATFNDIWGVSQGRTWFRRVVQYWAAITLGPILLVVILSLKVLPKIPFAFLQTVISSLLPFVILTLMLSALYIAMPNTRVNVKAALLGGAVAATLWTANSAFSFVYASRVARDTQIYGALGAVPLFLFGLYLSWLFLLFGAQFAYSFQHREAYLQERQIGNVSQRGKEFAALRIMTHIAESFSRGDRPPTYEDLAKQLAIPGRLVCKVINPLLETKLILPVNAANSDVAYVPARPLESISYLDILNAMRGTNTADLLPADEPLRRVVRSEMERVEDAETRVASQIILSRLVHRLGEQRPIEAAPADYALPSRSSTNLPPAT